MKKKLALLLSAALCLSLLASCGGKPASSGGATSSGGTYGGTSSGAASSTPATAPSGDTVTIQIGFENTLEEPIGQAVQKWAELLEEQSGGAMKLELFANSALGSKSELIDQMVMGENIITIADGAFYADYGVPDMGIMYGPFFFETWDDVWALLDSDWYAEKCQELADKGLTILASNWVYGERELMTKTKVVTPADVAGQKIRLANSQIYVEGFNALGATAVPMALGDVYTALQNGTLDGVENPLSTLYGQSFQEVTKYILMTGHIKNFTTWCIGTSYLNTLTADQQALLVKTGEEAGLYNNELQAAANDDYAQKMIDAGVEITELTEEQIAEWKAAAQSFYEMGSTFGWSDGLYQTTQAAMGK
ncbi:MAG: TRAP transporter substrate-binding protein DctP [Lawsonibacter sp.]|nr:TRAP transporter substrate-binding protein DctP [Lawsonibacter sp.]